MKGGLMFDERFLKHISPYPHPECPDRLLVVWSALQKSGFVDSCKRIPARPASVEELSRVHDRSYVERTLEEIDGKWGFLDPDTYFSPGSKEAALFAAGGVTDLARAVWNREVDWGIALPRPPGHHATKDRSMGFCLFNNMAVAVASLLHDGAERILIFDWDVHHGNGTQEIFYHDPRVMFISVHQWPHYPGSGHVTEMGSAAGLGFTANVPLPAGAGDAEYAAVMDRIVDPLVHRFDPQMILVSAGFDPYDLDMLAGMNVTVNGFAHMAWKIREAARSTGRGPCVVLEGGYHLDGLSQAVTAVAKALDGEAPPAPTEEPRKEYLSILNSLIFALEPYWPDLKSGRS